MIDPLYPTDRTNLTTDQMVQALETARDIVAKDWTTGKWFDRQPDGRVLMCVEGALIAALWGVPEDEIQTGGNEPPYRGALHTCPLYDEVMRTINDNRPADEENPWEDMPGWNDSDYRTNEQVEDVLVDTIKRLRSHDG